MCEFGCEKFQEAVNGPSQPLLLNEGCSGSKGTVPFLQVSDQSSSKDGGKGGGTIFSQLSPEDWEVETSLENRLRKLHELVFAYFLDMY